MRSRWIALAAALAACSEAPQPSSASFRGPTAAAVFMGVAHARPGALFPYLAVADGRGDDLRILDPSSDQAVSSPGYAFPLSVPVMPSPRYLASASLRDGRSDLLAVAGVGSQVQVVATWDESTRVAATYELSGLAGPGAEILSLAAVSYPGPPAGTPPVATVSPGRALLLVGFSGSSNAADGLGGKGKLVVVELDRAADGKSIAPVASAVKPLGFDATSLALSPDGLHAYAATPDPITDFATWTWPLPPTSRQVQGAAAIDMSAGLAGAWPVRGLDARAPTTLVAAAVLGERSYRSVYIKDQAANDKFGPPVARVYAVLDASGCGPDARVGCGIVTLDPASGGLAPDPAPGGAVVPAQTYRTPMELPTLPLALAVGMPAVAGETQCVDLCPQNQVDSILPNPVKQPLMRLAPSSGQRWTTAVAAAAAADGNLYVLDLGRYQPVNDIPLLTFEDTRLKVTSAVVLAPTGATAQLGLYQQYGLAGLSSTPADLVKSVILTPGFTRNETWWLTWQGVLPALGRFDFGGGQDQPCAVGLEADGSIFLALQTPVGTGWLPGPDVTDPHLAIHAATAWPQPDLAVFALQSDPVPVSTDPAKPVPHEARIAAILPKSPLHPGGALKLDATPADIAGLQAWLANPSNPRTLVGKAQVRAPGLVLVGSLVGYAGRPQLLTAEDLTSSATTLAKRFNLAWAEESGLTGEALILARKARRHFYPYDRPCAVVAGVPSVCYGPYPEMTDPLMAGPVVGFIAGAQCLASGSTTSPPAACPLSRLNELQRSTTLAFNTGAGFNPMYRRPVPISVPTGAVALDKSQFSGLERLGTAFYVTYELDTVLMAPPGQGTGDARPLR